MIPLDLDAMEAAAQRLLTAHGLTADGTGDNDRIISPAITSARDVLALAAALRTERAAREAAEAQHAALAAAGERLDTAEADHDAKRDHLTALLAGAPCGYVEAPLVRAYLAAVEAFDGGALGAPCRASIRVDNTRAALVAALEK